MIVRTPSKRSAAVVVLLILALSTLWKIRVAQSRTGFLFGDDQEIAQVQVERVYGTGSGIPWKIRNPLTTHILQAPAILLLRAIRPADPWMVVLLLRGYSVVVSTILILLAGLIARIEGGASAALWTFMILATSPIHNDFSATVLPRTFEACAVLAAVAALDSGRFLASGLFYGLSLPIRYSSYVFFPAFLFDVHRRRGPGGIALFSAGAIPAFLAGAGIPDLLVHGRAFTSAVSIFHFTIIEGASTRGFQPWHFYVTHALEWATPAMILLGLLSIVKVRRWIPWLASPMLLLSMLPHKEVRYMVPFIPVLAIAGGVTAAHVVECIDSHGRRLFATTFLALLIALPLLRYSPLPSFSEEYRAGRALAAHSITEPLLVPFDPWLIGGSVPFGRPVRFSKYEGPIDLEGPVSHASGSILVRNGTLPGPMIAYIRSFGYRPFRLTPNYVVYLRRSQDGSSSSPPTPQTGHASTHAPPISMRLEE